MSNRLKSGLLVRAGARTCNARGVPAFVVRKGDEDAGAVYVKLNHMNGDCVVLSQVRTQDGDAAWMRATGPDPVSEGDADAYIERQAKYDPDLWVLEVETPDGWHPFVGPEV